MQSDESSDDSDRTLQERVNEDLAASSLHARVQTMALSVGLVAFGIAVGALLVGTRVTTSLTYTGVYTLQEIATFATHTTFAALATAGIALTIAVALEFRARDEHASDPEDAE